MDLFYLPLPPPPARVWRINFTSGASFGTALPCVVAKGAWWAWFGGAEGVNARLARFLLGCQVPPTGHVCVLDYYDSEAGLVELMITVRNRSVVCACPAMQEELRCAVLAGCNSSTTEPFRRAKSWSGLQALESQVAL